MGKRDSELGRHVVYISEEAHHRLIEAISASGLSMYELMTEITLRHAKTTAASLLRERLAVSE